MNKETDLRPYRATFILDNRGKEESIEQIIEGVKSTIAIVSGEISAVENLGRQEFARVTDRNLTGASYVQITFSGPPAAPTQLKEKLHLNHSIYRTFVQAL